MSKSFIIYQIRPLNKDIQYSYVGRTQNLTKRRYWHKNSCTNSRSNAYNQPVYQFIRNNGGWREFEMVPLEEFKCESKLQAKDKRTRMDG
jgi:hypothetical protein